MSVGLLSGGAFVHAPYYLADAFSIIPNNYIYIYIIYIYTCVCVCVCVCVRACVRACARARAAFIR